MKNVTINTSAPWVATFRSYQDGDVFRESVIDLQAGDLADRLGYLKAQVDNSAKLTSPNTFTAPATMTVQAGATFEQTVNIYGALTTGAAASFGGGNVSFDADGDLVFASSHLAGVATRYQLCADANETRDASNDELRVPTLGANRTYKLDNTPPPRTGARIRVTKAVAEADTLTVQREDGTTLAVLGAGSSGAAWADFIYTTKWIVSAWGGDVTSIHADTL